MSPGTKSVLRAAAISLVLVGIGALLVLKLGPSNSIGYMHLRVVNDTNRTLKIQPCWDAACLQRAKATIVLPHHRPRVGTTWPNDVYNTVTIGVVKPNAVVVRPPANCVVESFAPGTRVAVFHVSAQTIVRCPQAGGGGGLG